MFCPKCGQALERGTSGELVCRRGDMGLSPWMEESLTRRYAPAAPPQRPGYPFDPRLHGGWRWYCPGCGDALDARLACGRCGRHLRDLVHPLVELHPHHPLP